MEGKGITKFFSRLLKIVLLLIMTGRAHCGKVELGNSKDIEIKIEWKRLWVRLTAWLIKLCANKYKHICGPTGMLKSLDCGVIVDSFAAATMYLAPCEPGLPINSRHCCSIRTSAKQEQNRTLEKLLQNKLWLFLFGETWSSGEYSEFLQVSMTEQLSGYENETPGAQMADDHLGTPNTLEKLLRPDPTSHFVMNFNNYVPELFSKLHHKKK